MENNTIIDIKNLSKTFGNNQVLKNVNITATKGESIVIIGKSGSGKSVTIKCLVGLVKADGGNIKVFGKEITTLSENELNPIRVKIGFMFQNGALYDSMSVRQNLAFTVKHHSKNLAENEVQSKILEALE
ncbi:MAG: putative ribonucleotide transport ATP-binding protein mkl, partial [Bacteroidota bacterium]